MKMPKVIAHRGASADAPENTLAAFQLALDCGADGIELDVMLSKDEQLAVIHDDTINRTTNGSGRVKDMTLAELQTFDAGGGQKIPSLAEVFDQFGGKFLINIELKNYSSILDSLPVKVARLVEEYDLADSVLISSFNPFNLPRFRRRMPKVPLGLITQPGQARFWVWRLFRYEALIPHLSDVDTELVSAVHARNLQLNTWTPDDPDEIRRLAEMGVDGLVTNVPKLAREVLES
jgi:glycerophosphoryl diester phosphodiesterase